MKLASALIALALLAGCTSGQTLEVNEPLSEDELISRTEHALGAQIREKFGEKARVAGAVAQGQKVVLLVANEALPVDSDAVLPMAIAVHDSKTNALAVPGATYEFKEARVLGSKTALVKVSGELELVSDTGSKVLATGIKGDIQPAKNGAVLATQNHPEEGDANSRVVLVTEEGESKILADAEGSDDRASLSPDGRTVLFVSARTGVASFFITDIDGAEPTQLTNKDLALTLDDTEPANFVPVPVDLSRLTWLSPETVRFDAGGNELWTINIKTGVATKAGGAR